MSIAVVTGTSTGIGLATAVTLARAGHTVYATMRNPKTGGEELRAIAERGRCRTGSCEKIDSKNLQRTRRKKNRSRMPHKRPLAYRQAFGIKNKIAKTQANQFFHIVQTKQPPMNDGKQRVAVSRGPLLVVE